MAKSIGFFSSQALIKNNTKLSLIEICYVNLSVYCIKESRFLSIVIRRDTRLAIFTDTKWEIKITLNLKTKKNGFQQFFVHKHTGGRFSLHRGIPSDA